MASISTPPSNSASAYSAKTICRIVGFVCLSGFLIDMLVIALPPSLGNAQWRVGFLQQLSDRSIVLLIGAALTIFSFESRRWMKRFAVISLVVGVMYLLASIMVIRDGLTLQQQAETAISTRASQIQTLLEDAQAKPNSQLNLTPDQLREAPKTINSQANAAKQNAKATVLKTSVSSIGNLVVVGLGLISLGRYGMRLRKSKY